MTRHLKLAAAVLAVLFTISGFAPAGSKSRGHSHSHSHGGGGCSSSHSSSHNYHHDDDDTVSSSGSSSGRTSTPTSKSTPKPNSRVMACASSSKPWSVVQLDGRLGHEKQYVVSVTFLDAAGDTVDTGSAEVDVPGHASTTVKVRMPNPSRADQVESCQVLNVHQQY